MKNRVAFLGVILVGIFLLLGFCKKGVKQDDNSHIVGTWKLEVQYTEDSNLNLPKIWIFTFNKNGQAQFFLEPSGAYELDDEQITFECDFFDRFRDKDHNFIFLGDYTSHGSVSISGTIKEGSRLIGTFRAQPIDKPIYYPIQGTWDFNVTITDSYSATLLPDQWQFIFSESGELWFFSDRKQNYDFDGINIRFPCHYYHNLSDHSAKHLMFVGEVLDRDKISGVLYNDVGDGAVIGTFTAQMKSK